MSIRRPSNKTPTSGSPSTGSRIGGRSADAKPKALKTKTVEVDGKTLSKSILATLDKLVEGQGDGRVSQAEAKEQLAPLLGKGEGKGKLSQMDLDSIEHGLANYRFTPAAKIAITGALRDLGHVGIMPGAAIDSFEKTTLPGAKPFSSKDVQLAKAVLNQMGKSLGLRDESVLLSRLSKLEKIASGASKPAGGLEEVGVKRLGPQELVTTSLTKTYGAMGDLFYLGSAEALVPRAPQIREQAKAMKQFRTELSSAKSINELVGLGKRWSGQRLNGQCNNELLQALMDQAKGSDPTAFVEAAKFYQSASAADPTYRADEIGREFFIVCLNKSGKVDESITEARSFIDELTDEPGLRITPESVATKTRLNGEVLAGAGKALKLVADKAAKGEAPSQSVKDLLTHELGHKTVPKDFDWGTAALEVSTRYYEAGFTRDFEYYPGIVSVYQNYEKGDPARAEAIAPMVYSACEAAGGKEAGDYWCLATQMELSLILGRDQDFADILPKVLEQANVGWMLSSTVDKMDTLATQREGAGEDTSTLRFAIETLSARTSELDNPTGVDPARWVNDVTLDMHQKLGTQKAMPPTTDKKTIDAAMRSEKILGSTADFRALTSSHAVGGNVAYGGQIPDITITRRTVHVIRDLMSEWGFDKIDNFQDWNQAANTQLNKIFSLQDAKGHRPLEDLHSDEHDVLDNYDQKRFVIASTDESGDSRTDLLAIMALGIGDCRPTGFAKQLLFDVWQTDRKNTLLHKAFDALTQGDQPKYDKCMAGAAELDKEQLRTITCRIDAPIQMKEMYDWKEDSQGRPLRDQTGTFNAVENHTFNVLVKFDDNGKVKEEITAADGFYHQLYALDGLQLNASDFIDSGSFVGDKMGTKAADGSDIPYTLEPSEYSGALLKEFDVGSTDFKYCGQTTAPPTLASMLFEGDRLGEFAKSLSDLDVTSLQNVDA